MGERRNLRPLGLLVVYDGVVRPSELPGFAVATGLAAVHYAVLLPSVTTCVERVSSRHGHGFASADATRAMHRDFAGPRLPARHLLADVQRPPEDVARQVLDRITAGSLLRSTLPR